MFKGFTRNIERDLINKSKTSRNEGGPAIGEIYRKSGGLSPSHSPVHLSLSRTYAKRGALKLAHIETSMDTLSLVGKSEEEINKRHSSFKARGKALLLG